METIDIQNKSFVVRWLKVSQGDTISYQLKPLKKSIEFGIYKKPIDNLSPLPSNSAGNANGNGDGGGSNSGSGNGNASPTTPSMIHSPSFHIAPDAKTLIDFTAKNSLNRSTQSLNDSNEDSQPQHKHRAMTISAVQQQSQEIPLPVKLSSSGLVKVSWLGTVPGNDLVQGNIEVLDDKYYYAFILDNTASKTVKKKVLFNASVLKDDAQSILSFTDDQQQHQQQHQQHQQHQQQQQQQNQGDVPRGTLLRRSNSVVSQNSHFFRVKHGRILQGYLLKKRRKKLQGFTKRFFKLDFKYGTLSYYLNERNGVCRGEIVINLSTVSANEKTRLIIIDSGMEIWVLKATDRADWQEWVDALELCFKNPPTEPTKEDVAAEESANFLSVLQVVQQKLEELKFQSLEYTPLHSPASPPPTSSAARPLSPLSHTQNNSVSRTSSFSSLTNAFAKHKNSSSETIPTHHHEHDLYKKLSHLESIVGKLTKQMPANPKTQKMTRVKSSASSNFSDNEYFDAMDNNLVNSPGAAVIMLNDEEGVDALSRNLPLNSIPSLTGTKVTSVPTAIEVDNDEEDSSSSDADDGYPIVNHRKPQTFSSDLYPLPWPHPIKRRDDIQPPTATPPSLLSFLRKNVGKDLTSISMPITSNEPISILQMLSETFEYSNLLNLAAKSDNDLERLSLVSAFAVSYLSMHRNKARALRKPFNPLLGETFELVREDMGIRLISEKVSHKPQVFAFHVEHESWEISYTVSPVQKFWGKSIEFMNDGVIKLNIKTTGECFHWSQPTTILKNILAGERYIEPVGQVEVVSSKSLKAKIEFKPGGMFSGRSEELMITLSDGNKKTGMIKGQWTKGLVDQSTGKYVWKAEDLVPQCEKKYGFTKFTANLNDITEIEQDKMPPTDSRLRPDLRLYENGETDQAENLKLELEQKQRDRRNNDQDVQPKFFEQTSADEWKPVKGQENYWERRRRQDWADITPLW